MIHPLVPVFLLAIWVATFFWVLKQRSTESGLERFGGAVIVATGITILIYGVLWMGDGRQWP